MNEGSIVAQEVNQAFFNVFDHLVVHYFGLGLRGATHFQNAVQFSLVSLVLLDQVQVGLLYDLHWVAENFDAAFDSDDALADIVQVSVAWFTAWLANLLEAGQVEQRVLELLKIELKLVG